MSLQKRLFVSSLIFSLLILYPSAGFAITLDQEMKQAQLLLEELKNVTPGTRAADQVAMKIMHNYQCKKLLKSDAYKDTLGATFHDLIYGKNGIADRILNKARAKLASGKFYGAKYKSFAEKIESIRNQSSFDAKKPPMDLDFGIMEKIDEGYTLDEILKEIKKEGGNIKEFHDALQEALEDSFRDVGADLDLPADAINPEQALIAGTTGFHPEAYKDVGAIKGDTPLRKWVSQSADVSRYKVIELQKLAKNGLISPESAAQEAARGTLKDLDKLEETFKSIAERTGKTPTLSAMNDELRELLEELVNANDTAAAQEVLERIKALSKGRHDVFSACNNLIDNMEAAWKLADQSDPERLFKRLLKDLLPEADYKKVLKALEDGNFDDLPISFQNLRKKLFNLAAAKRTALSKPAVEELLQTLEGSLMLKGVKGDTRQVLIELIEHMDSVDDPKLFNMVFGEQLANSFQKIKKLLSDRVKGSLISRLAKKIPLKTVDGKFTSLELGDSGSALGADAFIGIAMTLNDINNIMEQDLPPEEETRELEKAIVSNMPIVGDFLMSINTGVDAYYEGDYSKGAQSAAYLVIGIGGMVPGAQIPALIAGLGMATGQIGGLAWDAYWDRKLINSWVQSGFWDDKNGKLLKLIDKKDNELKIDFESLVGNFTGKYKYDYEDMDIRDSIHYYVQKHLLKGNKTIASFRLALKNTYPDADIDEALKQPGKRGEGLIRAAIKLAGDSQNIERNLALAIYRKYKQAYDACAQQAIDFLKKQAEAEYQALHQVGEAKAKRDALEKLGKELKVPLVKRVEETFTSFITFLKEAALSTLSIDTMGLKRQKIFEDYLAEYTKIKDKIMMASQMITSLGLNPPAQWNLTGYVDIDKARADEIYNVYFNALIKAKKDAIQVHKKTVGDKLQYTEQNPCDRDMKKNLAAIGIRIAHTQDLKDLYLKRFSTAQKTDLKASISESMPLAVMVRVVQKYKFDTSELDIFTQEIDTLDDRLIRLEKEYEQALLDSEKQLKQCFEKEDEAQEDDEDESVEEDEDIDEDEAAEEAAQAEEVRKLNEEQDRLQKEREEKEIARVKKEMEAAEKERLAYEKAEEEKRKKEEAEALAKKKAQPGYDETDDVLSPNYVEKRFGGIVSDVWAGGVDGSKFGYNRKEAKYNNPHEQCTTASAWGTVWGKHSMNWEYKSIEEYSENFNNDLEEHKRWGRKAEVIGFSMVGFAGQMVDTKIRFRGGSGGMGGFKASSVEAFGHGYAIKGKQVIEFGYNVGGSGCFNNSDRAFLESQAAAIQAEAKSILGSISRVKDGEFKVIPYNGPKLDGSKFPKVSLNPNVLKPLKLGETATITAEIEDAEAEDSPFIYNWTGDFSGKGKSVTIQGKKPGKFNISVSVEGVRYPLGSASLEYEVADYKVSLARTGVTQDPVAIGGSIGLKATLTSGGKAVKENYIYRFQPHPEVRFKDLDSASNQTTATFLRLGTEKIWVQVLKKEGDVLSTIAKSDQIAIEVTEPELELTASPDSVRVGEVVTMKVVEKPAMDDETVSFWWEVKGNTMSAGAHANDREYKFIAKDTKPVSVVVHAKGVDAGDDLGEKSMTVTATPYTIKVSEPKAMGPAPQIWKEGEGLVDVKNAIAVFQNVTLKASVSPDSKHTPLSYKWTVSPEGCTLSSPTSQQVTANASQAGTYMLTVTVEDGKGIELGTGKGSLSVTISQQQMNMAKQKGGTTTEQIVASNEKLKKGKLDEAIADVREALKANPDNQDAKKRIADAKAEKEKARKGLEQVEQLINESEFQKAQDLFFKLKNRYPYHPPVQKMEKQLQDARMAHINKVKAALGDVRVKSDRRDYKEALEAIEYARNNLKLSASQLKTLSDSEAYLKPLEAKKENARELFKSSKQKFEADDYDGCIKDYLEGFNLTPNMWNVNTDKTVNKAGEIYRQAVAKKKGQKTDSKSAAQTGPVEDSSQKTKPHFQMNFAENFNHKRPIKPYKVDQVPVAGYNDKDAYMVCLGKCQTQFNDGVCYPENYEWTVPLANASQVWITTNLFWWGNHASGQPIAKVTVSGDKGTKSFNMIGNNHTGEWNQNQIRAAEGVTIHDGAKSFTTYESRVHVARFSFDTMKVNRIKIELLTAAKWGDKSGVFAIYGVTLVRGGESEQQTGNEKTTPPFDFESGNLKNWTKTGDAFNFQPTFGDNPTARGRGQASHHQGNYWIGSFEKRQRAADPAGQTQGDGPQGTLTSAPFKIDSGSISFLIGGGCDINVQRVELLISEEPILKTTGKCTETMERFQWDVSNYKGKTAQIRIIDASSGGWGHINFDDLRIK